MDSIREQIQGRLTDAGGPLCLDCVLDTVIEEVLAAEERDENALADALIEFFMDEYLNGEL